MRKGQGSIEFLIFIAFAIALVSGLVIVLTTQFGQTSEMQEEEKMLVECGLNGMDIKNFNGYTGTEFLEFTLDGRPTIFNESSTVFHPSSSSTYCWDGEKGALAHYAFNTDSPVDSCMGLGDGTINGGVTTGQPGVFGKSYHFDGTGYVNIPYLNLGNNFSYSMWIKQGSDSSKRLFSFMGTLIGTHGDQIIYWNDASGSTSKAYPNIDNVNWHHIVTTSSCDIYFDGIKQSVTGSCPNPSTTSRSNRVGAYYSHYWTGFIDEVQIFDYELTEQEVKNLYECNSVEGGCEVCSLEGFKVLRVPGDSKIFVETNNGYDVYCVSDDGASCK